MLELPKKVLENKIGEFYTALTNDKRFILLERLLYTQGEITFSIVFL